MNTISLLIATCTIAFWGFVGLEEGGSTANSVKNPNKSVPLAIILGTSIVALICLINTIARR
jgi:amino acid transporter